MKFKEGGGVNCLSISRLEIDFHLNKKMDLLELVCVNSGLSYVTISKKEIGISYSYIIFNLTHIMDVGLFL